MEGLAVASFQDEVADVIYNKPQVFPLTSTFLY